MEPSFWKAAHYAASSLAIVVLPRPKRTTSDILSALDPCPFCVIDSARILIETELALAIPDGFPVAEGHTLVVPRKHVSTIYELTIAEQGALWQLVGEVRSRSPG